MANEEDIARLRQGVAVWNEWRAQNQEYLANLRNANLRYADLRGVNLEKTDCTDAKFYGAKLDEANLEGADFRRADFRRADFRRADFGEANLKGANLTGAYLDEARLTGANLEGADFTEANLCAAKLHRADLSGANLSRGDLRSADERAYLTGATLDGSNLDRANLSLADLSAAHLYGAKLEWADFIEADLRGGDLRGAKLRCADLRGAKLHGADLRGTDLSRANLEGVDLAEAKLGGANLEHAILIKTNLTAADLTGCRVYGISVWDVELGRAEQRDLVITEKGQPEITVDNIEVGQFIYLLLHNEKIRSVIDTIGKKGVLLLGRFTEGRLAVLERLRTELRKRDFVPMVFNFDKPETKDFTETVRLLAGLSRFVIVDMTNPRSAPLELQAAVPEYMIPFVPIIEDGEEPFAMFQDPWVKHRAWVLDPIAYGSVEELIQWLDEEIIKPALARFDELLVIKTEPLRVRRIGSALPSS